MPRTPLPLRRPPSWKKKFFKPAFPNLGLDGPAHLKSLFRRPAGVGHYGNLVHKLHGGEDNQTIERADVNANHGRAG